MSNVNTARYRITAIIDNLSGGGAERNLLRLSEFLANVGHTVTVVTLNTETIDFYSIPQGVARVKASGLATMRCRWFDYFCLRKRAEGLRLVLLDTRPDLLISFIDTTNIRVLSSMSRVNIPIIVSERIDWRYHYLNWRWLLLRRIYYPLAARVVVLSKDAKDYAKKYIPKWRLVHIYNPVPPIVLSDSNRPEWFGKYNIVAMGRLVHQKGFDLLIESFLSCYQEYPEWNLTIIGEGQLRGELEHLVVEHNLSDRVFLPGAYNPPFNILKQADLFVFSSRYEAFGMALAEAMACGLPVISFDCPSGPSDIVRNQIDGILVPPDDVKSLSKAMRQLMGDGNLRKKYAANATDVVQRFSTQKIMNKWIEIIDDVMKLKKGNSN